MDVSRVTRLPLALVLLSVAVPVWAGVDHAGLTALNAQWRAAQTASPARPAGSQVAKRR
jgi:hypothetical protein